MKDKMINPQKIAFDIDGVVANTMMLFIDIAQQIYGINGIAYEDITDYQLERCLDISLPVIDAIVSRILSGNYTCRLQPIKGAVDALRRLGAHGGSMRFITARPNLGPIKPWMDKILPPQHYKTEILAAGSFEAKPDMLIANGVTHFVEDRLDTCFLLQEKDITPVLFVQPWNRKPHPFIEVQGWDQLEALIDF